MDNPDHYRDFFKGQWVYDVVGVTIAKNNGEMIQLLALRRALKQDLEDFEAAGFKSGDAREKMNCFVELVQAMVYDYGFLRTRHYAETCLAATEKRLREIVSEVRAPDDAARRKKPHEVYVTFGTEAGLQRALETFEVSALRRWYANVTGYDSDAVPLDFEGTVLEVRKPVEPSEVCWQNSGVGSVEQVLRVFCSWCVTGLMLALFVHLAVVFSTNTFPFAASVFITVVNTGLPTFLKNLTDAVERHKDYGDVQDSMFLKLIVSRFVNTAIAVFVAYNARTRLSKPALEQVMLILLADAFLSPLLRVLDPWDTFLRYVSAPRMQTQRGANRFWRGAEWHIAERYTDVAKTLFVGAFYAAALPSGIFVTSAAIVTTFFADRYCLLRRWRRVPEIDAQLAKRMIGIVSFIVFLHFWASMAFFMNWGVYSEGPDENYPESPERMYETSNCFEYLLGCRPSPGSGGHKNFTKAQRIVYAIYRPLGFIAFGLTLYLTVGVVLKRALFAFCSGVTDHSQDETNPISFRTVKHIELYVPLVQRLELPRPLIAALVTNVPQEYLHVELKNLTPRELASSCLATASEIVDLLPENRKHQAEQAVKDLFGTVTYYEKEPTQTPLSLGTPLSSRPVPNNRLSTLTATSPYSPSDGLPDQDQTPIAMYAAPPVFFQTEQSYVDQPVFMPPAPPRLPPGWSVQRDPSGQIYYLDDVHKTTSWDPPTIGSS